MMDTVQQIASSFVHSAQMLRVLQNEDTHAGMNNRTNLQSLFETRWSSRETSLYTFKSAFIAVVTALEYLKEYGDGKVRCYLLSIKTVEFSITIVTVEHVRQSRFPLTTSLQSKQCNICQRDNQLQQELAEPEVWDALFDNAEELAVN